MEGHPGVLGPHFQRHRSPHDQRQVDIAMAGRESATDRDVVIPQIAAQHLLRGREVQVRVAVGELSQDNAAAAVHHAIED